MKKVFFLLVLCLIGVAVFVNYSFRRVFDHSNHLSFSVSENERTYKLNASYSRYKTGRVQHLMDAHFRQHRVFEHARIDGVITLDDPERTHFYVKCYPGSLYIKLDKTDNDPNSYLKMKDLAEDIKKQLGRD